MKGILQKRSVQCALVIGGAIALLASSGNPPNGRTGAPFDGHCNGCHGGNNPNNYSGSIDLSGVPATIEPNTTYPLTITMTANGGNPSRGGFQLVAVDGNNANAGDLTAPAGSGTGTETSGGREYIEHRNPKNFSGNGSNITWTFDWKSPVAAAGNTIKFYFIGNWCNGSGSSGDYMLTANETYSLNAPPPPTVSIATNDVLCFNTNTGSATATAGGGSGNFNYLWSNAQTTQTIVNLFSGIYTVTVTDAGSGATATASATITQPPSALSGSASVTGGITCSTPSAFITAQASGGTPPYNFNWSNGNAGNTNEVNAPGTYTVTISDGNACTRTATATVQSNTTPPVAQAIGGVQPCTPNSLTISGQGSSTGANFAYAWSAPAGGTIVSGATSLNPVVSGAGSYILTVTNTVNGCTSTATAAVTTTPPLVVSAAGGTVSCAQPSVVITANTATSGVTYAWTGPNFSSNLQNPSVTQPGSYTVVVTQTATGCTGSATVQVNGNLTPPAVSVAVTAATCVSPCTATATATPGATLLWTGPGFSSSNATVTIPPSQTYNLVTTGTNGCTTSTSVAWQGNVDQPTVFTSASGALNCVQTTVTLGAQPAPNTVTYQWSGAGIVSGAGTANPVVNAPGPYTVTITNTANGCTVTATETVAQNITPPVIAIAPPANLHCNQLNVVLNATGSAQGASFSVVWNGPGIVSGANTLTPTVNAPGAYNATITDNNNGCSASASATVTQNGPVNAVASVQQPINCFGAANGIATAQANGGSGVFSYLWSGGQTGVTAANLPAGVFTVTVTDTDNCTGTAVVTLAQPTALGVSAAATPETAQGLNDGTAVATAQGGTASYTYLWSNTATTAVISGLAPGAYTVTVTDANGCTAVQTVNVNAFNCLFSAAVSAQQITCNGAANGAASVTFANAQTPVAYLWSNQATTQSIEGLAPGVYSVSVTDASNCALVLSTNITEPSALTPNASATPVTAVGANDGTALAGPAGGVAPYTYLWSNGGNTAAISGLAPGAYTVTVGDANNCSAVQTVLVNNFNCNVSVLISGSPTSCFGTTGTLIAQSVNGVAPVTYQWSNGATTAVISNLPAGVYTVTMTDANGCADVDSASVQIFEPLLAEVQSVVNVACPSESGGSALIAVSGGGTAPYTFTYPNNPPLLAAGNYTVTVTNPNGCTATVSVTISSNDTIAPTLTCPPSIEACDTGNFTGFNAPVAGDNCSGNLVITQITGQPSNTYFPVGTTLQTFQVSDAAGNTGTCTFTVTTFEAPDVALISRVHDVNGAGVGSIDVEPISGTAPFTYYWRRNGQDFATTQDLAGLFEGVYLLVMTDVNGCVVTMAAVNIQNTVGSAQPFADAGIWVAPNPVTTSVRIHASGLEVAGIEVYDTNGRLLYRNDAPLQEAIMDTSDWASGVYIVVLTTVEQKRFFTRLVK